MPRNEPPKKSV